MGINKDIKLSKHLLLKLAVKQGYKIILRRYSIFEQGILTKNKNCLEIYFDEINYGYELDIHNNYIGLNFLYSYFSPIEALYKFNNKLYEIVK